MSRHRESIYAYMQEQKKLGKILNNFKKILNNIYNNNIVQNKRIVE